MQRPPAPSLHVLVVDDEPEICALVQGVLRDEQVHSVNNGAAAIAALSAIEWDVVVCDLEMPAVSGVDVYRAACALSPGMGARFIFMTTGGPTTDPGRDLLEALPSDCRLDKPFDALAVKDAVAACVTRAASL